MCPVYTVDDDILRSAVVAEQISRCTWNLNEYSPEGSNLAYSVPFVHQ